MHPSDAQWILVIALVFIVLPPLLQWTAGRPAHSARRIAGLGLLAALLSVAAAALLARLGAPATPALVAGGTLLAGSALLAVRRRHRDRELERKRLYARENLAAGPALLRIRPAALPPRQRGLGRLDAWLAADGPTPSRGWWNNGCLAIDHAGPAHIDAAGLRHALPEATTTLVVRTVPRALLLVDGRGVALARLPLTGFTEAGLRRFADVAGWDYRTVLPYHRIHPDFTDLRRTVIDRAASRHRGRLVTSTRRGAPSSS